MGELGNGKDRRASVRFDTRIDGALASSRGARQSIEITDLSTEGFNTSLGSHTVTDKAGYAVRFAGLEVLGAELRWSAADEAGFKFDRPLHPAVLDHIVRENPPANDEESDEPGRDGSGLGRPR
ncbi:hypothetical protein ACWPM1_03045 [Tsuneonella sp. HG249]